MYLPSSANYSSPCPYPVGPFGLGSFRASRPGRRRRGVGALRPDDIGSGFWVAKNTDCSNTWQWLIAPGCWGMSPAEWAIQNRPLETPRPPTAQEISTAYGGGESALVQKLLNEQMAAQQKLAGSRVVEVFQPVPNAIVNADEYLGSAIESVKGAASWLPWVGLAAAGGLLLVGFSRRR